jgi:hypothetical protein
MKDPKVWWAVLKWLASLVAGAALNEAAGMVVKGPCKRWLEKGSVLDNGYSVPNLFRRYKRWFR